MVRHTVNLREGIEKFTLAEENSRQTFLSIKSSSVISNFDPKLIYSFYLTFLDVSRNINFLELEEKWVISDQSKRCNINMFTYSNIIFQLEAII